MTKLEESLIILDHYNGVIEGRANFCKNNIGFTIDECINSMMINHVTSKSWEFKEEDIVKISRECANQKITIHSYVCLIIIDIFSYNDEYNDFFSPAISEDIIIKERILKVRTNNKNNLNIIDWNLLKRVRNRVLAHNLRDDKKKLAIDALVEFNEISNFTKIIDYSNAILYSFDKIKEEFDTELLEAKNKFKELVKNYHKK